MEYDVVYMAKQGLILSLVLSLPVVVVASLVGLLFSMFQALTQLQDQTLSFTIKLLFIIATLYMAINWMAVKLYRYSLMLFNMIG